VSVEATLGGGYLLTVVLARSQSAGSTMSIVYGHNVTTKSDPPATDAFHALSTATSRFRGDTLNDLFVYLPSWVPFSEHLLKAQKLLRDVRDVPLREVMNDRVRIIQWINVAHNSLRQLPPDERIFA